MIEFCSIWGNEIYTISDSSNYVEPPSEYSFDPIGFDYIKNEFYNTYVICHDCKKILSSILYISKDKNSCCPLCRSTKLYYVPQKFTHEYEKRVNEELSDLEFFQFLLKD